MLRYLIIVIVISLVVVEQGVVWPGSFVLMGISGNVCALRWELAERYPGFSGNEMGFDAGKGDL